MHRSSLLNMKRFAEKYLDSQKRYMILDIGAQDVGGVKENSYKNIFSRPNWKYITADIADGKNVDLVLRKPYSWNNIRSSSFDCVVCGQMFEHDEFFWLTMLEIERIMKPGGFCCIIAPSGGPEHRYPVDCYRYYPDGLRAVAKYAGLETIEAYAQWNEDEYPDMDNIWRDCVLICRRPKKKIIDIARCGIRHWMIKKGSQAVADIDYGDSYSEVTTWAMPKPDFVSSVYFDTGFGFNEEQTKHYPVKTNQTYREKIDIPKGCENLRFDPIEGYRCIVRNFQCSTDISDEAVVFSNGEEIHKGNFLFWDTIDPKIAILVKGAKWIEIEANISYIG